MNQGDTNFIPGACLCQRVRADIDRSCHGRSAEGQRTARSRRLRISILDARPCRGRSGTGHRSVLAAGHRTGGGMNTKSRVASFLTQAGCFLRLAALTLVVLLVHRAVRADEDRSAAVRGERGRHRRSGHGLPGELRDSHRHGRSHRLDQSGQRGNAAWRGPGSSGPGRLGRQARGRRCRHRQAVLPAAPARAPVRR